MAKTKTPLDHAERWIGKQGKALRESTLPDGQKAQLIDWCAGVERALQTIDQVIDPDNPPGPDTVHGKLIALGRSQRLLTETLAVPEKPKANEGAGQGGQQAPATGQGQQPQGGQQAPATGQGQNAASAVGV